MEGRLLASCRQSAPRSAHIDNGVGHDDRQMTELRGPVLNVDWGQAVTDLVGRGWACAPRALAAAGAAVVAEDDGRTWHVAGDEGGVRQHVIGSYSPYADALPAVRAVGDQLVAGLTSIARQRGLPSIPAFNEATAWALPSSTSRATMGLQRWDHFPWYRKVSVSAVPDGAAAFWRHPRHLFGKPNDARAV